MLKKNLPFFFILVIWFIFSSAYFLFDKVPFPSTYQVNHFPPWSSFQKYWGPVKNGAMPDIIDQIYPWRHFTFEELKNGRIPLWNPYSFSGNPHSANFQSAVFSIFNLLFFILPFIQAWSILILLQPLFAGIFTYLLTRELSLSKIGALISSVSFMFCGFVVVWMAYGTLVYAIIFLPFALYAIEKYLKTQKKLFLVFLFISLPLSFFSGHFQISFYFLIFLFFYLIYNIFFKKLLIKKSIIVCAVTIFFGILVSMPQLLPSVEFYKNSVRSEIFLIGGIPFYYLVNFFSPDFFGNPVTRNDWFGFYAEWASFIGTIPFLLAVVSFFNYKNIKNKFFIFSSLLFLIFAIDSPLQKIITLLKIPVLSTSNSSRIIVLASFSLAILAGFGFDLTINLIKEKKHKKLILPLFTVITLFIFIWLKLLIFRSFSSDKIIIAIRNFSLSTLIFFIFLILLNLAFFKKRFITFFSLMLLLITSFESLRFVNKWLPFEDKNLVFPKTEMILSLQKNIGFGRYFGNLGEQVATYYRLSSIEGYDPLYIERYGEFLMSADKGNFHTAERSVAKINRRARYVNRVIDLLGVNIIFNPIADTNQSWAFPVWQDDRFKLIYKDDKFELFKNTKALARADLFYDYEVIKDKKEIIKRFYSDSFDFRKTLILEKTPGFDKNTVEKTKEVRIIFYLPDKIKIEVNTASQALLFLADNFYPGWKAYLDNKETEILRADYTFRAVSVPPGHHVIKFEYQPESFRWALYFAVIGLLGFFVTLGFSRS